MKFVILILCTLALTACGGGGSNNSVVTPVVTNATVNPKILSQNLSPATTDLVDYPTPGGYDYSTAFFAFGKFGSANANCMLTQSIARGTLGALPTYPDAPIYVVCQQADGSFQEVSNQLFGQLLYATGAYPLVADFNNDGIDDVFIIQSWDGPAVDATWYTKKIYGLISKSDGTYSVNNVSIPAGYTGQTQTTAMDINQDGCLDVVGSGNRVWLGDCAGGFSLSMMSGNIDDGINWFSGTGMCAADFNNTGAKQFVVTDEKFTAKTNNIYEVDKNLNVTAVHPLPTPYFDTVYGTNATHNFKCITADINNDGKIDVIVFTRPWAQFTNNSWTSQSYVQVYLNQGNWQFQDISATALPGYNTNTASSYSARLIDVNGDGYLDIALEGTSFSGVSASGNQIWINNKDSTFTKVFTTELATLDALIPNGAHGVNSMLPIKVNNTWNYIVGEQDPSSHYHILLANTQFTFK